MSLQQQLEAIARQLWDRHNLWDLSRTLHALAQELPPTPCREVPRRL